MSLREAELAVRAVDDEIDAVNGFVDGLLEGIPCGEEARAHLDMAVEEIFVNICSYAYPGTTGEIAIRGSAETTTPYRVSLVFEDEGLAFNPLEKAPPPPTAGRRRQKGGLGIFLARRMTDEMIYERRDGKNILTITKKLAEE